jgi:predicted nucleic acid-binding protein
MGRIIIDAGPLVALLDTDDQFHAWAKLAISRLDPPLTSCDAVLSEACFRLSSHASAISKLRQLVEQGILTSDFMSHAKLPAVFALMEKYANVPMSFADACLVCMVEDNQGATVLTADHHFTIYRQQRRRIIPLIAPF